MNEDTIIVVSGLPRSGTSLTMSMLEAGGVPLLVDTHRAADESNPHGYFELEAVKTTRHDPSWLAGASGHAVKVIHALLADLPDDYRYDVLFVERDLREVVESQRAMLARSHGRAGAEAVDPRVMMDALRRQVEHARHALAVRKNVRWVPVPHRRLLRDPHTAALEIARFLGRGLDVDAMVGCLDVDR